MDPYRIIENATPMRARCVVIPDRHGVERIVAIAKLTWSVSPIGVASLAAEPSEIRMSDVPEELDPPERVGVRYPSDLVEEKPGTDVILVGDAHPTAADATSVEVSLRVEGPEPIAKKATVYGPRVWRSGMMGGIRPSNPGALPVTPLTYGRTWGGDVEGADGKRLRDERNPVGIGIARDPKDRLDQPAPAIEDGEHGLASRTPAPGGFGPIPSHWAPRVEFAGTFDAAWRRDRSPVRPEDFDVRFHSAAAPGLWSKEPLFGDEAVEVLGATAEGRWIFRLPRYTPQFTALFVGYEPVELETHLDTFLIDCRKAQVELTWRASVKMPRKSEMLTRIQILGSPLPDDVLSEMHQRVDVPGTTAPQPEVSP